MMLRRRSPRGGFSRKYWKSRASRGVDLPGVEADDCPAGGRLDAYGAIVRAPPSPLIVRLEDFLGRLGDMDPVLTDFFRQMVDYSSPHFQV